MINKHFYFFLLKYISKHLPEFLFLHIYIFIEGQNVKTFATSIKYNLRGCKTCFCGAKSNFSKPAILI